MNIRIKRFDTELPLPEYKTKGAAALDLCARVATTIAARSIGYVPLNVAIEPPAGHYTLLAARSSLHKKGLMPANGIGIIDPDYSGDSDELVAALYNFTDADITIPRGERIMQALIVPFAEVTIEEVETMENDSRGGFGTTGQL